MISKYVLKSIFTRCIEDRCPQIAASLAYATLLSLIPLTVILYKIFITLVADASWQLKVQDFVFKSLAPTTADQVKDYFLNSAVQANSLNYFSLLMLLVSVIAMIYTIDKALNSIWHIHKPRYVIRRIFVYLVLLIFGPLAISFSIFISTYFASLPLISKISGIVYDSGSFFWLPVVILWVAFTMLYKWVPDSEIKWSHAFSGATVAVTLFEIAKHGFALYISYFPLYELLYGALASIPLMLIWIYLIWLIVLLGAEITHFLQIPDK